MTIAFLFMAISVVFFFYAVWIIFIKMSEVYEYKRNKMNLEHLELLKAIRYEHNQKHHAAESSIGKVLARKIAASVFNKAMIESGKIHELETSKRAKEIYELVTPCDQVHLDKKDIDVQILKRMSTFKSDRLKISIHRSK